MLVRMLIAGLNRHSSAGAILCFHSITTPELPSDGAVHVSVAAFERAIAVARRLGRIVPLRDLFARHRAGRSTAGLSAVTFDDAYAALLPTIGAYVRREELPITVFAVSDPAAEGRRFWWDRIDELYPRVARSRWRAFEDTCGLPDEYRRGQPAEFGPLRPLRQWILATHAGRWPAALDPLLDELEAEAAYRTAHRSMTYEELSEMAALPGVDIGVHTRSHPVLPLLGDAELVREVKDAFDALRERFASTLPVLALPFGLFDARTLRLAREAGMVASLTLGGTPPRWPEPDAGIPRHCMCREDTGWKLALRLSGLAGRVRRRRRGAPPYPTLPSPTT